MKLQASSILYAVIVAVLVALMSASLLLHARLSERHVRIYRTQDRVLTNASSGMELLLSEFTAVGLDAPQVVDLFDEAQDSVYLERRNWGIYEVAVSRAYFRNIQRERIALVGYDLHEDSRIALYLADQNKPLSLCGNTEVRGTAFVPKAGVKRAYIEGQNYNGRQLIYGEQKQSSRQLPALSSEMLASNRDYLNGVFRETDSVITFDELDIDTVAQSFARPSLVVAESGPIDLLDGHYAGNIILISDESVFIGAGAELDGVLVYAPQITVEEGFTGRAQLFASARIAVGPSATLAFPSVVGLIKPEDGQEETAIALSEAATVRGIVFIRQ
ncbi:MAG: hypothetical protein AAGB22_13230, partial [Bacteroidota bacterium]